MGNKPKIYLAGKITNNNWRSAVYDEDFQVSDNVYNRNGGETISNGDDYYDSEYDEGNFIVTGAHSIGCDHGCFHSCKHASIEDGHTCYCIEKEYTPKEIVDACCHQIAKSDIVFAYIDSDDCHGTISEIGYAYSKHKFIYILFKTPELKDKLWFISNMAKISECLYDYDNEGNLCANSSIRSNVLFSIKYFKNNTHKK